MSSFWNILKILFFSQQIEKIYEKMKLFEIFWIKTNKTKKSEFFKENFFQSLLTGDETLKKIITKFLEILKNMTFCVSKWPVRSSVNTSLLSAWTPEGWSNRPPWGCLSKNLYIMNDHWNPDPIFFFFFLF